MIKAGALLMFFFLTGDFAKSIARSNDDCIAHQSSYTIDFDSLLNKIDVEIRSDWDPPGKLLTNSDFMLIYSNPQRYINDIRRTMGDKSLSDSKKMICLYGIQKLELADYIMLSNYCLELVDSGRLKERILYMVIFPHEWTTDMRFAENYKLPGVRFFLKKIINDKNLPWRKSIKRVANGRMLRERNRMIKKGWEA